MIARLSARSKALSLAFSRSMAQRIRARVAMPPPGRFLGWVPVESARATADLARPQRAIDVNGLFQRKLRRLRVNPTLACRRHLSPVLTIRICPSYCDVSHLSGEEDRCRVHARPQGTRFQPNAGLSRSASPS